MSFFFLKSITSHTRREIILYLSKKHQVHKSNEILNSSCKISKYRVFEVVEIMIEFSVSTMIRLIIDFISVALN